MRRISVILSLALFLAPSAAALPEPCKPVAAKDCPKILSCPEEEEEPSTCARPKLLSSQPAEGLAWEGIAVRQWQIGNLTSMEIPHQGFLIVQLRAGALVTLIEDKREEWAEGSFWSVPAGKRLIVQTANDSVVLQTVDLPIQ